MPSRINIEGFVSKNPERRTAGNHTVTTVTIPIEKGRRKDGQWVPDTDKDGQKIVVWWEAEFWNEYGQQIEQDRSHRVPPSNRASISPPENEERPLQIVQRALGMWWVSLERLLVVKAVLRAVRGPGWPRVRPGP